MFNLMHGTSNYNSGRVVATFDTFELADVAARSMYMRAVEGTQRSVKSSGDGHYVVLEWDGKLTHVIRIVEHNQ